MIGAASAALPNDAGGGGGAVMTRRGAAVPPAPPSPDGVGVRAPAAAPPSEGRVAERPAAYGRGATGGAPTVPLEATGDVAGAAPVAEGAVGEGAAGGVPICDVPLWAARVGEAPAGEAPVAGRPVGDEPADGEPAEEEPVEEEPAEEEPVEDERAVEDPAPEPDFASGRVTMRDESPARMRNLGAAGAAGSLDVGIAADVAADGATGICAAAGEAETASAEEAMTDFESESDADFAAGSAEALASADGPGLACEDAWAADSVALALLASGAESVLEGGVSDESSALVTFFVARFAAGRGVSMSAPSVGAPASEAESPVDGVAPVALDDLVDRPPLEGASTADGSAGASSVATAGPSAACAAPANHSRTVSARPTETGERWLTMSGISSAWQRATMSLELTPSSLASW